MALYLFANTLDAVVTLEPTWGLKFDRRKIEDVHRTRAGGRYVYKWGSYGRWILPVEYVPNSDRVLVVSWWLNNVEIFFTGFEAWSGQTAREVMIVNREPPLAQYVQPYDDLWRGKIELEQY